MKKLIAVAIVILLLYGINQIKRGIDWYKAYHTAQHYRELSPLGNNRYKSVTLHDPVTQVYDERGNNITGGLKYYDVQGKKDNQGQYIRKTLNLSKGSVVTVAEVKEGKLQGKEGYWARLTNYHPDKARLGIIEEPKPVRYALILLNNATTQNGEPLPTFIDGQLKAQKREQLRSDALFVGKVIFGVLVVLGIIRSRRIVVRIR
jgi:hypothetical protein